MIIIADSGSTKTDWSCFSSQSVGHYQTKGLNPYHIDSEGIINELSTNLTPQLDATAITKVFFYGAGCSIDARIETLSSALKTTFPTAKIHVWHDLLAACRGLYPTGGGIAGILGTGSNACIYENGEIKQGITSFGYILGDEGGGVHLGKLCLKAWLQKQMPRELSEEFAEYYHITTSSILDSIYKQPQPNRFLAQFTTFAKQHESHPFFHELIMRNFDDWFRLQIKTLDNFQDHALSCIGSIAENFKPQLEETAAKYGIEVKTISKSPMSGLVKYHSEN